MSELSGRRALVIEDDQSSINILTQLMDKLDVFLDAIQDSIHIENILTQTERPDVIFLDLEMPRHNGYTVLKMIQAMPEFADIPVIAYTVHVSHLNEAKEAGFHSFLSKPLDPYDFANQLTRIMDGEPVWEVY